MTQIPLALTLICFSGEFSTISLNKNTILFPGASEKLPNLEIFQLGEETGEALEPGMHQILQSPRQAWRVSEGPLSYRAYHKPTSVSCRASKQLLRISVNQNLCAVLVLHVEGSEWNQTDSSWCNCRFQVPVGLWLAFFLLAIYDVLTVINDCRSTLSLILPSFRALAARFPNQMNGTQYFRWGDLRWSNNFLSSAVIKPLHKIKIAGLYRLTYSTRIQNAQRNINGDRESRFLSHRVSLSEGNHYDHFVVYLSREILQISHRSKCLKHKWLYTTYLSIICFYYQLYLGDIICYYVESSIILFNGCILLNCIQFLFN